MKKNGMRSVPPGEILNEEFLKPLSLMAKPLAKAIGVPPNRITALLKDEKRHHRGHSNPTRSVFRKGGGILDKPATDLRPGERWEGAAGESQKEH